MPEEMSLRRGRGRPPGPPVDPARRREELLDAAERAIRVSGRPDVGLADIASAAGLTRSAVYAVFSDRSAVMEALARRHADIILRRLAAIVNGVTDPAEQTRAAIDILARWFDDEPALARALTGRLDRPAATDDGLIVGTVADILRDGFIRRGGDPASAEPWAHALVGAVATTVGWWAQTRTMSREQIVDHLFLLVWAGFSGVGRPLP
ncbi:TetR/AcrR family transcriptional regulator [Gordonia desulfuricans]|uniref:TetR/AcrR family transcriptional regulator n=1 Tax=Gordonia desulfuricans TaxID=89051 RepID=A0A7K3LUW8_9ACTN|nr:TetR/AcrR family transcriptional regulator [Gordonia desulfuricans]NDK91886.1 TetR/AcrR family transcriptional regulator [Gordonia desulfuricans]